MRSIMLYLWSPLQILTLVYKDSLKGSVPATYSGHTLKLKDLWSMFTDLMSLWAGLCPLAMGRDFSF